MVLIQYKTKSCWFSLSCQAYHNPPPLNDLEAMHKYVYKLVLAVQ